MSTSLKERLNAASVAVLGTNNGAIQAALNRKAEAVMIETDNGTIETPFIDIAPGDPVMIEGEPAADGEYVVAGGNIEVFMGQPIGEGAKITVVGGVIDTIEPAAGGGDGDGAPVEDLATLQAKVKELEEKTATAEAKAVENEKLAKDAIEKLEMAASKVVAPAAQAYFNKGAAGSGDTKESITKETMAERRAQYKAKK